MFNTTQHHTPRELETQIRWDDSISITKKENATSYVVSGICLPLMHQKQEAEHV